MTNRHNNQFRLSLESSGANDDELERSERLRHRALQDDGMFKVGPTVALSHAEVADHYTNCIKLSTENKITAKNAFGLHLIDYMEELVRKNEMKTFQVASTSLDAGAKIYAGRVDAVHAETFRVLSTLGRTKGKSKAAKSTFGDEENEESIENQENEAPEKHSESTKAKRKPKKINFNPKLITLTRLEEHLEINPLFSRGGSSFDESGIGNLMLNQLSSFSDYNDLILDCNMVIHGGMQPTTFLTSDTNFQEIKDKFPHHNIDNKRICPTVQAYVFFKPEDRNSFTKRDSLAYVNESLNDEGLPQTIPDVPQCMTAFHDDDDDDDGGDNDCCSLGGNEPMAADDDAVCMEKGQAITSDCNFFSGDPSSNLGLLKEASKGGVADLIKAIEPSEFSYFNKKMLDSKLLPTRWKIKSVHDIKAPEEKIKKRAKKEFEIDFENVPELTRSKALTYLSQVTINKMSGEVEKISCESGKYSEEDLLFLGHKTSAKIRKLNETDDVDDAIEGYDYQNIIDEREFCGNTSVGDCDDDDDLPGFDASNDELFTQEQMEILDNPDKASQMSNMSLVERPQQVEKLEIAYAKTARKMDMKKLKANMWKLLHSECKETEQNVQESQDPEKPSESPKEILFSKLLEELPSHLSASMARNLTVPMSLVCLLHLANENNLTIASEENLSDLRIQQNSGS